MKNLTERDRQAQELSGEIMRLARNTLLVNLRFIDRVAGNLRLIPDMNFGFAGSGAAVVYSPWTVILMYRDDDKLVTRNLLHSMLHNVFRHSFVGEGIDRNLWNLSADIAVENAINDLGQDFLRVKRETEQAAVIDYLREEIQFLTAERIYSYLSSGKVPAYKYVEWPELFSGDQHDLWYGAGGSDDLITTEVDLEELWKDISKKMQTELELFGREDSALTQNIREINRVRYNYTEFLRKFGKRAERMRLSDEEFDNNYYTYGLELYGNIPLIEPLEYRDSNNIRDFVIAIDTSGSVRGEIVQKFIQHTHDVLAAGGSFDTKLNMYIIQCDDAIQDITLITSAKEFENYFREKQIKGLGQTDFRPVFEYVEKLRQENKLKDLRGLLYFTDGKGKFPAAATDYDTAFIIYNDSLNDVWVPEWAMKIEMQTEEIMQL